MAIVYLHIGRGKTGTTAIQAALSRNRRNLLDHGIHYISAGHQSFAKSFIAKRPAYMVPSRNANVREQVATEIAKASSPRILLSSENLTLADTRELKSFLESIGSVDGVRVIFFVRSQDELAESQYNQMVKLKGVTKTFEDYVQNDLDETDFFAMASEWADRFGSDAMICRIYDARSRTLTSDFLSCLAPDEIWPADLEASEKPVVNESLGFFALQYFLSLNRLGVVLKADQAAYLASTFRAFDLPALLFDADAAASYRGRFAESNLRFSERFLDDPKADFGGRRYTDEERSDLRRRIRDLKAADLFRQFESMPDARAP